MKKVILMLLWAAMALPLCGQVTQKPAQNNSKTEALPKVYDEQADAMVQIDQAIVQAQQSSKLVICQVGGNWCPWCLRFAKFISDDPEIAKVVEDNFVYVHINTSKTNKNREALVRLGNPGRFGYPVFVILDTDGRVMHIQNSSYLEQGNSYDRKKVLEFFLNWTRQAIENIK